MDVLKEIGALLGVLVRSRASLVAENLALRQQLTVLGRSVKRPRLRRSDRISGPGSPDSGLAGRACS